ncbi:MAG TPA: translocation/assembly module TamB domain-containing protein [Gammaproteobacteria bacterium]
MVLRTVTIGALALAGLLLLVAVTAAWLLGTESGLRFAFARAAGYLPEGIEIGAVQGTASGPLVVRDVRVNMQGFSLALDRLELEWRLSALFGRELRVERLRADGLRYTAHEQPPPPPEEKQPFELPERIDLPLDVFVDDARVRDIAVQGTGQGEPFVVHALELVAQWTDHSLEIENLALEAPLVDARAQASVLPRGNYPLEASLAYTVRPPQLAPLTGSTRIDGSLADLRLLQTFAEPYNLRLQATAQDVLDELRFDADLEVTRVRLAQVASNLPPAVVSTKINATGGLDAIRVELNAQGSEPEIGPIEVDFAGEVSPEAIAIDRLTAILANGRIQADGRVELTGSEPRVDVAADWSGLQWPLSGSPQVASERGRLEVTGTLADYRARLDAALGVPNQADGRVALAGTGDDRHFDVASLDVATLEGTLHGTAGIAWAPVLAGRVDLTGRGLNPAGLAGAWPGRIDLAIRGEGSMPDTGATARLDTLHAEGRLRGRPVALDARGRFDDGALALDTFELRSGTTRVAADGRIGEQLAVDWSIASDDLAAVLPEAGGQVKGRGKVGGTLKAPDITAELSGSELRYADYRLASLELSADVAAGGTSRSELVLSLGRAALGGVDVEALSLQGAGTRGEHTLTLEAQTSAGRLDLGVDGALAADNAWAFVVRRLDYAHPKLESWSLQAPARGHVSAAGTGLEPLCLEGGSARLCVEGERRRGRLAAGFELEDLPLAVANAFLPPAAAIEGAIGGSGRLVIPRRNPPGGPTVRLNLHTTPIELLTGDDAETRRPVLAFAAGDLALDVQGAEGAELTLDLPLESGGGLVAKGTIAPGDGALTARPLEARLQARLPELGFLTRFTPQISSLRGRIEGDLGVSGTLAAPALNGSLALEDGAATLPGPALRLREINAAVRGRGAGDLDVEMRARSGEGMLRVEGTAGSDAAGPHADLQIRGEDFTVFDTPEATVSVAPDLDAKLANNRLEVTGIVRVPEATIELQEAPETAVGVSPDQVIVHADSGEQAAEQALAVAAKIQVILGDPEEAQAEEGAGEAAAEAIEPQSVEEEPVSFIGFGLSAALAGDLTVTQAPNEPTTATGEISVTKGFYTAYGQDLEIQRGRVIFAGGPIDEPGLDVRAVRQPAEDILVGVEVRGRLMEPEFSIFSDPSMSESEQLSWLVLGRGLEGGQASESSALARAALALGIKGGNFLTQQFGDKLGVDQIGIETMSGGGNGEATGADGNGEAEAGNSSEQAALVVGKYLSPDLYVSYGIGLLDPVTTLKLSYALSSKWRLVTESSSEQSGGDLFYTIER